MIIGLARTMPFLLWPCRPGGEHREPPVTRLDGTGVRFPLVACSRGVLGQEKEPISVRHAEADEIGFAHEKAERQWQRWVDSLSNPRQLLVVAGYLKGGRSHAFATNALDAWPVLLDGPRFRLFGGVFCLGAEVFSVLQVAVVGDS